MGDQSRFSNKCVPIGTPLSSKIDKIREILEHRRNYDPQKCEPTPAKLSRTQSLRVRPSYHFSIAAMVGDNSSTRNLKLPLESKDREDDKNGLPGQRLQRSVTFRITTTVNSEAAQTPPTSTTDVKCENNRYSGTPFTRTLQRSISKFRAKNKEMSLVEEPKQNLAMLIANHEEQIHLKIQALPSVIYQHKKGASYIPGWSWMQSFEATKKLSALEPNEEERYKNIESFHRQLNYASSLLDQLNHQLLVGLEDFQPAVDKNVREMMIAPVGIHGRSTISDATMAYMRDTFRVEKAKQKLYNRWMTKPLKDADITERRNTAVKWVVKTGKTVKYTIETVHLAVYFIDAYLTTITEEDIKIGKRRGGLIGIAALYVAGKLEESQPLGLKSLLTKRELDEVNLLERHILEKLCYDLSPPLAPLFANLLMIGGSLEFPTVHLRKLTMDLCLGILHASLHEHRLSCIPPLDKAKAALEISIEFIFYKYPMYVKKDMSNFSLFPCINPGDVIGDFVVKLCLDTFLHKFLYKNIPLVLSPVKCRDDLVKNIFFRTIY